MSEKISYDQVLYEEDVDKVDMLKLKDVTYVASTGGGPVLAYKRPRAMSKDTDYPLISVFHANGSFFCSFKIKIDPSDTVKSMGWTSNYMVMVMTVNLKFYLYNLEGMCLVSNASKTSGRISFLQFFDYGCGVCLETGYLFAIKITFRREKILIEETEAFKNVEMDTMCMWYNNFDDTINFLIFNEKSVSYYRPRTKDSKEEQISNNSVTYSLDQTLLRSFDKVVGCSCAPLLPIIFVVFQVNNFLQSAMFILDKGVIIQINGIDDKFAINHVFGCGKAYFIYNNLMFMRTDYNEFKGYSYSIKRSATASVKCEYALYDEVYYVQNDTYNTIQLFVREKNRFKVIVKGRAILNKLRSSPGETDISSYERCNVGEKDYDTYLTKYAGYEMFMFYRKQIDTSRFKKLVAEKTGHLKGSGSNTVAFYFDQGYLYLCLCALYANPHDPIQNEILSCMLYYLDFAKNTSIREEMHKMYLSVCFAIRMIKTMNRKGIMITYGQFKYLKDRENSGYYCLGTNNTHMRSCENFNYHPIQSLLMVMNEFQLCIKWCEYNSLSKFPVLSQWCSKKISAFIKDPTTDKSKCEEALVDVKRRMQMMSETYVSVVIENAMKSADQSSDVVLFLSNINNYCRSHVVKLLIYGNYEKTDNLATNVIFSVSLFNCDQKTIFFFFKKNLEDERCMIRFDANEKTNVNSLITLPYSAKDQKNENGELTAEAIESAKLVERFPAQFQNNLAFKLMQQGAQLLWRYITSWEIYTKKTTEKVGANFRNVNYTVLEDMFFRDFKQVDLPLKQTIPNSNGEWFNYFNSLPRVKEVANRLILTHMAMARDFGNRKAENVYEETTKKADSERVLTPSVFQTVCKFLATKKPTPEELKKMKETANVSDLFLQRCELYVIDSMQANDLRAKERLECFLEKDVQLLFPLYYFIQIAHDKRYTETRNKFIALLKTKKERLRMLVTLGDYLAAIALAENNLEEVKYVQSLLTKANDPINSTIAKLIEKLTPPPPPPPPVAPIDPEKLPQIMKDANNIGANSERAEQIHKEQAAQLEAAEKEKQSQNSTEKKEEILANIPSLTTPDQPPKA
ncbi:hypothetical protein EIN_469820 [Entamoeba invadens IP1]|uniref:Uncharacterized protein n=1 Tax=Entamoeba invadens IP1 TaxID=370355 RepID=A0A0A1TWM3_ENTIV|nr:hypothetical protein EIN_469820 [Entamoeba invadens IP1]ELP83758.1 hypothetical protein EIN_469820 [Entamoeba invadens IP1]|eukprot:XP_004183104.1 hypothetical protein EIN_469820 [Entamoeba invadens IP1]